MNTKLLVLLILFFSAHSYSQSNLFIVPIGGAEGITGNTGIARFGSVGAVLFNPAGLMGVDSNKISASGTAISQNWLSIQEVNTPKVTNKYTNTIPTQISTIIKQEKFNWGFSILVPNSTQFEFKQYSLLEDTANPVPVDSYLKIQELLIGPSIAYSLSSDYKIGLSVFASKLNYLARQTVFINQPGNQFLSAYKQTRDALVVYPILGLWARVNNNFSWGLRLSGPSVQISGSQKSQLNEIQNTGNPADAKETKSDTDLTFKRPTEIGAGFSTHASEHLDFLLDISFQQRLNYTSYDGDAAGEPGLVKMSDALRYHFGVEYIKSESDRITGGLFYSQSPERDLNNTYGDFYGYTVGYRSILKSIETNVGIYYVTSANNYDGENSIPVETKIKTQTLGFFINSAFNFL